MVLRQRSGILSARKSIGIVGVSRLSGNVMRRRAKLSPEKKTGPKPEPVSNQAHDSGQSVNEKEPPAIPSLPTAPRSSPSPQSRGHTKLGHNPMECKWGKSGYADWAE